MDEQAKSVTYHNLSAGSTTIMPDGKVIKFGGSIKAVEGGTQVGLGTYATSNAEEIAWLDGLCKMKSPQVWKEEAATVSEMPQAVANGLPADTVAAVTDIAKTAIAAADGPVVDGKVAELMARAAANATTSA